MRLIQKPIAKTRSKIKLISYILVIALILSCKPFWFKQGVGFIFDYQVAVNRVQRSVNWLAVQLSTNEKSTVVYRGASK